MEEIWKDIPGFEGYYQASNTGFIKSVQRLLSVKPTTQNKNGRFLIKERILKPRPDEKGYGRVVLYKVISKKQYKIHSLVLETFKGAKSDQSLQCRHLDGNNKNNHIDNLAWGTAQDNTDDKYRYGCIPKRIVRYGEKATYRKLDNLKVIEIRRLVENNNSYLSIANEFGVSQGAIFKVAKRKTWTHI